MSKKHYKAIVLIIASFNLPVYRNFIELKKKYVNEYPDIKTFFIFGSYKKLKDICIQNREDELYINFPDSYIPGIFVKTIIAMEYIKAVEK